MNLDTLRRGLARLREYLMGRLIFWTMRRRYARVFDEVDPLATYLEFDLFPDLREIKLQRLSLELDLDAGKLHFRGGDQRCDLEPYKAPALVAALQLRGISQVDLDTALESGQIGEAVLVLLHAGPALEAATPVSDLYTGWAARKVAGALLSPQGFKKFCAVLRVDLNDRQLIVEYAYCPLFLSRLVQKYSDTAERFADHRAFFRLAPRAAVVTLILFAAPALLLAVSPALSVAATAVAGVMAAILVGTAIHTIASIQYDKEHYEKVRKGYLDRTRHLARFPETNPDPVIEIDIEGEILYANPAANRLLARMGIPPSDRDALLPPDRRELTTCAMHAEGRMHTFEHSVGDRIYRYNASAFPDVRTVIVSGKDVTQLRAIERELRNLNFDLESKVRERTLELALTQDVTIMCLAGLAETRDPETGHHLDRTRHYVRVLAEHLRDHPRFTQCLDEHAIHRAFKSAPLHDIGKVGISDAVLLKPGKLTTEEFEEIKSHPKLGGDALAIAEVRLGFNSFLSMAKEIAYYHHERWDGGGYPFGLRGDAIPWPARLMALADVYDALTSRRPYKEPWTHAEAQAEILKNRGTQFDPDVVDAFIFAEQQFVDLARELAEPEPGLSGAKVQ